MKLFKIFFVIILMPILLLTSSACRKNMNHPDNLLDDSSTGRTWDDKGIALPKETVLVDGVVQIDPPSDELLKKIERDYRDYQKETGGLDAEYQVITYYGCYNKAIPIKFYGVGLEYPDVESFYKVAGYTLDDSYGGMIQVWISGDFIPLPEAYKQGILTKADIDMMFSGNAIKYSH